MSGSKHLQPCRASQPALRDGDTVLPEHTVVEREGHCQDIFKSPPVKTALGQQHRQHIRALVCSCAGSSHPRRLPLSQNRRDVLDIHCLAPSLSLSRPPCLLNSRPCGNPLFLGRAAQILTPGRTQGGGTEDENMSPTPTSPQSRTLGVFSAR